MRNLARHCISRQSSGPREHTRTGQNMPHRRSSDVASAVWLISEEATSRAFISPSVMAFTKVSTLARLPVSAVSAWIVCPFPIGKASQDGNSGACSTVKTGEPITAVNDIARALQSNVVESMWWQDDAACSHQSPQPFCLTVRGGNNSTLPSQLLQFG